MNTKLDDIDHWTDDQFKKHVWQSDFSEQNNLNLSREYSVSDSTHIENLKAGSTTTECSKNTNGGIEKSSFNKEIEELRNEMLILKKSLHVHLFTVPNKQIIEIPQQNITITQPTTFISKLQLIIHFYLTLLLTWFLYYNFNSTGTIHQKINYSYSLFAGV